MSATEVSPAPGDLDPNDVRFNFANTYEALPDRFFSRLQTIPVASPRLIKLNVDVARQLELEPAALASPHGVAILAGNSIATGSSPLAQAYAGHQFGHFVPRLGDGRTCLLGEVIGLDGKRYDIQLKGSGPTPFSRRGDGRAALGPVLREYIVSEAMAALGVPTTRALAAVATGQQVVRETLQPGAVFTRVAASHLRVGTFQYFAAQRDIEGLRILADYAIARHYPEATQSPQPYRALLDGVIARQASLVAQWMLLGFIHGVMNTDNTSISGETIDYGPCAFLEAYEPRKVFSSIDSQGRYAYSNQPHAAHWNMARLAEALLPVLVEEELEQEGRDEAALTTARAALDAFHPLFEQAFNAGLSRKLGLSSQQPGDAALAEDLLERMAANHCDFTQTFRRLADAAADPENDLVVRTLFADASAYDTWAVAWRKRLESEPSSPEERASAMRRTNPACIPRNHLVEEALAAAVEQQDLQPFERLLSAVTRPFEERADSDHYAIPARPEQRVLQTFCGT